MSAPAAAPIAVPITALFTPLSAAAWSAEVPPTWLLANCRQSMSSARNWSKLLPVPGSTITLGPVGMLTQAPSSSNEPASATREMIGMAFILASARLRGDPLPAGRAVLHVGVIRVRRGAVVPGPLHLLLWRCRRELLLRGLLDVHRRGRRDGRRIVGRVVVRRIGPVAVVVGVPGKQCTAHQCASHKRSAPAATAPPAPRVRRLGRHGGYQEH